MTTPLTRFAPSPTGYLHLGHIASALHVWRWAEAAGAPLPVLRIEDTDQTRCKPEYETAIYEDLEWLGLKWQAGVRRQSEHIPAYETVIAGLSARGLVYRCFRTRSEIAALGDGPYTGGPLSPDDEADRIGMGQSYAWRLSLDRARETLGVEYDQLEFIQQIQGEDRVIPADLAPAGDIILARKDTGTSYHLACCHDDVRQGMTHVIRGEDLADAAPIHTLLQTLMGWPKPVYVHHPLLLGPDGKKLAKRAKSTSLASYREQGLSRADLIALAGM